MFVVGSLFVVSGMLFVACWLACVVRGFLVDAYSCLLYVVFSLFATSRALFDARGLSFVGGLVLFVASCVFGVASGWLRVGRCVALSC